MTVSTLANEFVDAIAESVVSRCVHMLARPTYYSQTTSPLGHEQHLAAAGRSDFDSWKVGKLVLAKSDDVHRYIESETHRYQRKTRGNARQTPVDAPADIARRSLARVGLGVANDAAGIEQNRGARKRG